MARRNAQATLNVEDLISLDVYPTGTIVQNAKFKRDESINEANPPYFRVEETANLATDDNELMAVPLDMTFNRVGSGMDVNIEETGQVGLPVAYIGGRGLVGPIDTDPDFCFIATGKTMHEGLQRQLDEAMLSESGQSVSQAPSA